MQKQVRQLKMRTQPKRQKMRKRVKQLRMQAQPKQLKMRKQLKQTVMRTRTPAILIRIQATMTSLMMHIVSSHLSRRYLMIQSMRRMMILQMPKKALPIPMLRHPANPFLRLNLLIPVPILRHPMNPSLQLKAALLNPALMLKLQEIPLLTMIKRPKSMKRFTADHPIPDAGKERERKEEDIDLLID